MREFVAEEAREGELEAGVCAGIGAEVGGAEEVEEVSGAEADSGGKRGVEVRHCFWVFSEEGKGVGGFEVWDEGYGRPEGEERDAVDRGFGTRCVLRGPEEFDLFGEREEIVFEEGACRGEVGFLRRGRKTGCAWERGVRCALSEIDSVPEAATGFGCGKPFCGKG